jgi:Bifunctional DNA primase/polymerase, N-terminal/Family of unknown function (DUF5906)/Primase C terminal 2 (PriCT-2)
MTATTLPDRSPKAKPKRRPSPPLLYYAAMGLRVFPCLNNPGHKDHKKPLTNKGFKDATCDPKKITRWWTRWPTALIGIPTGERFNVLDLDVKKGKNGLAVVPDWAQRSPLISKTGTGGKHVFFQPDERICCTTDVIGPGVDTRGKGGYVIVPPSEGYSWVNGDGLADLSELPPWPEDLRPPKAKAKAKDKKAPGKSRRDDKRAKDPDELVYAVGVIPNNSPSWQEWKTFGMAIFNALPDNPELAFDTFDEYSKRWTRGAYDAAATLQAWKEIEGSPPRDIGAGTIFFKASEADSKWRSAYQKTKLQESDGVKLVDFVAYMPLHFYIFIPTREPWPATSVNARLPSKSKFFTAADWLDVNNPVEQMTWAPGKPMKIQSRLVADGGWIERDGVACFNLYRPPTIELGDATKAGPWLEHVKKIYPNDAEHIINWLAFKAQNHGVKINHALVLGGPQGIGKDTLLEPVKHAVGPWNFVEVSPTQMQGRFNSYVKSVILRVSEARDLGNDVDRYQFYEHTKVFTASPPDVLRCDEKNLREHSVFNVCGVVFTTNHKTNGIYLPADDRRHYVAWSELDKSSFEEGYWKTLWTWYDREGNSHVAAYLTQLDISNFDPKAPPPKTDAFWAIV